MSAEQFEELYDDHMDMVAQNEKEQEMFGEVLNMEDLENELEQLVADDIMKNEESIPDAGTGVINAKPRPAY